MKIYSVLSNQIPEVWERVLPLVNSALEYADGKWTPEAVRAALESQDMQLFILGDDISAIWITQVQQYPGKKVMDMMFCAGERMDEWIHLISEIEAWAKEQGCASIEAIGRPGWEKVLGWERIHVVVRKNLI